MDIDGVVNQAEEPPPAANQMPLLMAPAYAPQAPRSHGSNFFESRRSSRYITSSRARPYPYYNRLGYRTEDDPRNNPSHTRPFGRSSTLDYDDQPALAQQQGENPKVDTAPVSFDGSLCATKVPMSYI
jgi:hypothetical protein